MTTTARTGAGPAGAREPSQPVLAATKAALGLTVSVCIPARNEAATMAGVVGPTVEVLVKGQGLVDEVIVVDDGSHDGTGAIARQAGAQVVRRTGAPGKGAAMAEALRVARGDIVVFLDADVADFGPHFVSQLLGPLFQSPHVALVKGFYGRSLDGVASEGGRVTELLARPLIRLLFPELAFLRQPLAGETAVRREVLDELALETGYGVEMGMLIDVARRCGPSSIVEVDLGERSHRNRSLMELAEQADEVVAAFFSRVEVRSAGATGAHDHSRAHP